MIAMNGLREDLAVIGAAIITGVILTAALVAASDHKTLKGLGRGDRRKRKRGSKLEPDIQVVGAGGQILKGYRKKNLSIKDRLELMQGMVAADVRDPEMRRLALRVTNHCDENDDACEMRAIYDFVKGNVRYSGDIAPHKLWPGGPVDSVDMYSSGKRTLQHKGGDCDDAAVLVSSLAVLNGITAKFRATSPYRRGDNNYTHVYAVLGTPKNDPEKWIPVDTTLPGKNRFGEEQAHAKKFEVIA